MKSKLSGLLDGELPRQDSQVLFDQLKRDDDLCRRWQEYLLIRDALKGRPLETDLTARVMASLEVEPTVLAPARPAAGSPRWGQALLAMAATLAGVAVVGWLALGPGERTAGPVAAGQPQQVAQVQARPAARDMREYLMAHEAQSSSLRFRGGAEHIRTVAATR